MTGSEIAKAGFNNEQEVADKFNDWKNDADAQKWLEIMMYNLDEITSVCAVKIGSKGYKSDINVTVNVTISKISKKTELTSVENIQVKLVSTDIGFNQVEKKKVGAYLENWHIDPEIESLLMLYDGELPPRIGSRNSKRMFADEFSADEQEKLRAFFQKNLIMVRCHSRTRQVCRRMDFSYK